MEDIKIINRIIDGEEDGLELLLARYGVKLLRAARMMCNSEEDAEDILQETMLKVITKLHTFKGKSQLYTWIYGVLLNTKRSYYRKNRKEVKLDDFENPESLFDKLSNSVNQTDSDKNGNDRIFISALRTLGSKHREVLTMKFFDGMMIKDIADILRLPQGTIKSRLHLGMKKLEKALMENEQIREEGHLLNEVKK